MFKAALILLLCQLLGTLLAVALSLPVPGAVIGMFLLVLWLLRSGELPVGLHRLAGLLLGVLVLLFVPAGVGVMQHGAVLGQQWLALLLTMFLSTVAAMAATGVLLQRLLGRQPADG